MDAQDGGSYTAFTPMPLAGGRHRGKSHKKSHKHGHKLRVVTKKVAHHHLKKLGLRMRGGQNENMVTGSTPPPPPPSSTGGRRRHHRKSHKKHGLFGGMNLY